MAGFGFDSVVGKANSKENDKYVVLQVVLTEKFLGTGSGVFKPHKSSKSY